MNEELLPAGGKPPDIVRLGLLFEGGLAVAACLVGLFLKVPPWQRLIWRPTDLVWGLLATLPMFLGLLIVRRAHGGPLAKLNAAVDEMLIPLFARCTLMQLAPNFRSGGFRRGILVSGVLQPVLITWWGVVPGLLGASIVFGLLHAVTTAYAVLATVVGAYLGWLALATDNLLGPIIAHSLYDFLALIYMIHTVSIQQSRADAVNRC